MKHLISISDLGKTGTQAVLRRAQALMYGPFPRIKPFSLLLSFFQSSVRTRTGFAAAAVRLGGVPIDIAGPRTGREMSQEESISDAIRCASGQVDLMVLRHGDDLIHARAVEAAACPVINGGGGGMEHPTQALIDLFAIYRTFGKLEGLRIGLIGDLAMRSVNSLLTALQWFEPMEIRLMNPPGRQPEASRLSAIDSEVVRALSKVELDGLDVIYMAGLPERRGSSVMEPGLRALWALTPKRLKAAKADALILCPLPRIDEVDPCLDNDPRCRYFRQSDEGLYVRAAVLEMILEARGRN